MLNLGTKQSKLYFKTLLSLQEKTLIIIDFKPQASLSDCIFKENAVLKISDFANNKYALFVRKSLIRENIDIQRYVYPTKTKPQS